MHPQGKIEKRTGKWEGKELDWKELVNETDHYFAKQQLVVNLNETKILGLFWNRDKDLLAAEIPLVHWL